MNDGPDGPPTLPPGATAQRTATGLEFLDVAPGAGDPACDGTTVRVRFRGWLTDGTLFEQGGLEFRVGEGEVIPGFEEGVTGMRPGAWRRLIIPSDLAYGPRGRGRRVPPFATLIYDVELVSAR